MPTIQNLPYETVEVLEIVKAKDSNGNVFFNTALPNGTFVTAKSVKGVLLKAALETQ